jgi:integrase
MALTAAEVKSITAPGLHSDGQGLYLRVSRSGAKSWVFISRKGNRRIELGLGSATGKGRLVVVTLKDARLKAGELHLKLAAGADLKAERSKEKAKGITFADAVAAFLDGNEAGWKNDKHRAQWRMTLGDAYCKPLSRLPVDQVETGDVLKVLTPIWQEKRETATRLRGRIERVLDFAKVKGWRQGDNPARWEGHLKATLPSGGRNKGNHAALAYADASAFMARLREQGGIAALALEFTILTAARTGETIGATWGEIDIETGVWTIPAGRMKVGKEHRVPLGTRAVAVLKSLPRLGVHVFPGGREGAALSNMAMAAVLKRMGVSVTVHGFRSTFRDWAGDMTGFPREIAEAALAHKVGDATENAYRRSDALARRRALMEAWEAFLVSEPAANVVPLRSAADG